MSAAVKDAVRQLPTRLVEKVWGRKRLPAPFAAPDGKRIGEIWFNPPCEMPDLLVKYLFTSEKLSVQVHPSDADAMAGEQGKDECWLVLDAEPGARLAIGFDRRLSREEIEEAALDGSIEQLLTWHEVSPGDVYYLPAGTVHAIGPGIALVEVQQNSDTTFRLYDYGRPRDLHLERALAVAETSPYPARYKSTVETSSTNLIDGPKFRLDRVEGAPDAVTCAAYPGPFLALPLSGEVCSREAGKAVCAKAGECLLVSDIHLLDFAAAEVTLLTRSA